MTTPVQSTSAAKAEAAAANEAERVALEAAADAAAEAAIKAATAYDPDADEVEAKRDKAPGQEPSAEYFKFDPDDLPPGIYTVPVLGLVSPGRIYEVRPRDAAIFKGHPSWVKSSATAFAAQEQE